MEENKNVAPVTPELLIWAREKAGLTIADVVEKIEVVPMIITSWEQGQTKPTISEAQKLAEIYKVPFAAFFLPEAPKELEKITLREIIKDARREWDGVEGWYDEAHEEVFTTLLSQLKQLEVRIEETRDERIPRDAKSMKREGVNFSHGWLRGAKWACNEILGEKGDINDSRG